MQGLHSGSLVINAAAHHGILDRIRIYIYVDIGFSQHMTKNYEAHDLRLLAIYLQSSWDGK
jgi:hypothetical protein